MEQLGNEVKSTTYSEMLVLAVSGEDRSLDLGMEQEEVGEAGSESEGVPTFMEDIGGALRGAKRKQVERKVDAMAERPAKTKIQIQDWVEEVDLSFPDSPQGMLFEGMEELLRTMGFQHGSSVPELPGEEEIFCAGCGVWKAAPWWCRERSAAEVACAWSRASPGFPASWGSFCFRGKVQAQALDGVVEKLMESLASTEVGGEEKAAEGIAPVIPVAEEGEASLEAGGEAAACPDLELLAAAVEKAEVLMMGGESEAVKRAAATTVTGESLPGFSVQKWSFAEDWAGMMEEKRLLDMGVVGEIFIYQIQRGRWEAGAGWELKDLKISQYADDMTLFLGTEKGLEVALNEVKDFSSGSGAQLNVEKSKIKFFGKWRSRTAVVCGISLCEGPLRVLGVDFGGDTKEDGMSNWKRQVAAVSKKLGLWSLRRLIISGKVLAFKADVLPSLVYLARVYILPVHLRPTLVFGRVGQQDPKGRKGPSPFAVGGAEVWGLVKGRYGGLEGLRQEGVIFGEGLGKKKGRDKLLAMLLMSVCGGIVSKSSVMATEGEQSVPRAGLRNTARFQWRADSGIMPREVFGRAMLLGALKLKMEDVLCFQSNTLERAYDITLSTSEVCQRVLEECRWWAAEKPVAFFKVMSLDRPNFRLITVHMYNPHVSDQAVAAFLRGFGEVLTEVRRRCDSLGFWTGKRQFPVLLRPDPEGWEGFAHPPAHFSIGADRGYCLYSRQPPFCKKCRAHGHGERECGTARCRFCHKEGHAAKSCPVPKTCHRCGETGHLIRSCTKARPAPMGPDKQEERPEKGERHREAQEVVQLPAKPEQDKGPAGQGEHPKEGRKWCKGVREEKRMSEKARAKASGRGKGKGAGGSAAPGKAAEGFCFAMEGVPQSFAFEKEKVVRLTTEAMEALESLTGGLGTEEDVEEGDVF
ncbi:hypothetical protein SKAU_G00286200 [Synaphobranchus kaupii]|uniref:CCHC-type domain-containing protein n=1 Tax=Synaphobranchus kaupii TaxID=118154 RepID=A0A9Q1EYA1_SYNKA|nr:hypothetical protein SKAU_G00286200 [Synaphobranchus kaupii]